MEIQGNKMNEEKKKKIKNKDEEEIAGESRTLSSLRILSTKTSLQRGPLQFPFG